MGGTRATWASLVGIVGVAESALSMLLRRLRAEGLLCEEAGGIDRRQLARDLETSLQRPTAYGVPIQPIALQTFAGEFEWHSVNPFAMLNHLAREVPAFGNMLQERLKTHPCSPDKPWEIIYYCDETSAGNMLHIDSSRMAWLFYWSFKQLGPLLSFDSCWFLGAYSALRMLPKWWVACQRSSRITSEPSSPIR